MLLFHEILVLRIEPQRTNHSSPSITGQHDDDANKRGSWVQEGVREYMYENAEID